MCPCRFRKWYCGEMSPFGEADCGKKKCSIAEAVSWYNMAPKDGADQSTAPANKLYSYNLRVYGIDRAPPEKRPVIGNPYRVGDAVWYKPPGSRCDTRFTRGTVSKVMSDVVVEVNGMPRHIRDLCRRMEDLSDDDNLVVNANEFPPLPDDSSDSNPELSADEISASSPAQLGPRRGLSVRRSPDRYSP